MILSSTEIKRQLVDSDQSAQRKPKPDDWEDKKTHYAEVGSHIKRMTGTNGWKIMEAWLMHQLNIDLILRGTDRDRVRAEAFADVLKQAAHWVKLGELATNQLMTEEKET